MLMLFVMCLSKMMVWLLGWEGDMKLYGGVIKGFLMLSLKVFVLELLILMFILI